MYDDDKNTMNEVSLTDATALAALISKIARNSVKDELKSNFQSTDDIQEIVESVIENYEFETVIESYLDTYDFDDKIEAYMSGRSFSGTID